MSIVQNIQKHFKTADGEVRSSFDPPAIPFAPKATTLKAENSQEFSLYMTVSNKNSIYKNKVFTFLNDTLEDLLEWEKKMNKVIKCKLLDMVEGKFDLVGALLRGDALTCWIEFKYVETMCISKRPDGTDKPTKGICDDTLMVCLQELKRHYFPKNLAWLQKAYLYTITSKTK
eukprot:6528398-Ditylum_brightwellii.AAC.1